jgi:hypothetical protein
MSRVFHVSRASLMPVAATLAALCLASISVSTETPHFYPDDPIAHEPESQNAAGAKPYEIQSMYEMTYNLFVTAGHKPSDTRARDINSIDEVPDSSWFTNRIGPYQTGQPQVTTDAIARGPIAGAPPDPSHWVLIGEKTSGVHPGFRARDARGETWFIELDPKTNPEGATAAVTIATKFFWALGYNQVETFLTTFDPKLATIDPAAKVRRPSGKKTSFTWDDLHSILETAARNPDGTYRIVAGRLIPGKILGNFRFNGTRSDDPNDIVPHEDRRELRALRVFGAWTNLTDLKAGNTLDTLITTPENGRGTVRHYLQDVGSTFGMCNDVHEWDLSYEYFYDGAKTRRRFLSLGFALSPWQDDSLRRISLHRQVRGRPLRSARMASADADHRLHGDARRRCVLGRAAGRGVQRRADQGRDPYGPVQRSRGRAVSRRRPDQASAKDRADVPDRHQSDRRSAAGCERPLDHR